MLKVNDYIKRFAETFYQSRPVQVVTISGLVISISTGLIVWIYEGDRIRDKLDRDVSRISVSLQRRINQSFAGQDHPQQIITPDPNDPQRFPLAALVKEVEQEIDTSGLGIQMYIYNRDSARFILPESVSQFIQSSPNPYIGEREGRNFIFSYINGIAKVQLNPAKRVPITLHSLCLDNWSLCTRELDVNAYDNWYVILIPHDHTTFNRYRLSILTVLTGLLITFLLADYLASSYRYTCQIEEIMQIKARQAEELQQTLEELKDAQASLIQSEKMSSLGQLVAGVAHEINNPVNFIHGNLPYLDKYFQDILGLVKICQNHNLSQGQEVIDYLEDVDIQFIVEDLPKVVESMKIGTERIRQIVKSLKTFSRVDGSELKPVDIHAGIDSTLMILQVRTKPSSTCGGIIVNKNYGQIPLIECYGGQLNQVFMNILSNAIDALEDYASSTNFTCPFKGEITISTEIVNGFVQIKFQDNGPGIPEQIRAKLFDPFFTTKPVGKGTGLGLSISYKIVTEKHHGRLYCLSEPNCGAIFVVEIPIRGSIQN